MTIDHGVASEAVLGYACLNCGAMWVAAIAVRECEACGSTELEPIEPDPSSGNDGI